MTAPTIRDYGDRALLLECGSTDEVLAVAGALRAAELPGVTDIIPGARTVLVALSEPTHQAPTRTRLADIEVSAAAMSVRPDHADVVIDVVYDGADLAAVAALVGMDTDGVVAAHTGALWRVGYSIEDCIFISNATLRTGCVHRVLTT
jgi:allophanate hydrolase subunit 1